LRITAAPAGAGHLLFLGIGPASAVDRYLSGVSHDVATDVSVTPFHLTLARHGGTATPPPPGSQSFWVAQASGTNPTLTWTVKDGSYRVVVMNTDAAAPVAFAAELDLTIPHLFAIGIGLLIGGIVLIVMAIVLIVLGARTRPQSRPVPDLVARA
jgi:Tol biopolymer transport system component